MFPAKLAVTWGSIPIGRPSWPSPGIPSCCSVLCWPCMEWRGPANRGTNRRFFHLGALACRGGSCCIHIPKELRGALGSVGEHWGAVILVSNWSTWLSWLLCHDPKPIHSQFTGLMEALWVVDDVECYHPLGISVQLMLSFYMSESDNGVQPQFMEFLSREHDDKPNQAAGFALAIFSGPNPYPQHFWRSILNLHAHIYTHAYSHPQVDRIWDFWNIFSL